MIRHLTDDGFRVVWNLIELQAREVSGESISRSEFQDSGQAAGAGVERG